MGKMGKLGKIKKGEEKECVFEILWGVLTVFPSQHQRTEGEQ